MKRLINWIVSVFKKPVQAIALPIFEILPQDCQAYDPTQDEEKILRGEIESYFD